MDFFYDVCDSLLKEAGEWIGEEEALDECAERMEDAVRDWKAAFGIAGSLAAKKRIDGPMIFEEFDDQEFNDQSSFDGHLEEEGSESE